MVDFLLLFGQSVSLRIRQDPTILLVFTSIFGSIVPLFLMTKIRNINSLGNFGSIVPLFPVVKNNKYEFFGNHFGFSLRDGGCRRWSPAFGFSEH